MPNSKIYSSIYDFNHNKGLLIIPIIFKISYLEKIK